MFAREAPVGNVAWIPSTLKPCIGQRTVLIRPIPGVVDGRYLSYLLLGDECQNRMHALSGGATVSHLNMSDIRRLELPELPKLREQQKIATILSTYDDLIENNLRRIKILEEMAQNLYREWFVKFRFPGHEQVPMVDSPLGKIPEGWEVNRLGSIAEEVRRGIPKGELHEMTPYVGLEHIPRKSLALDAWEEVTELGSNKLIFEPGEILFGKIRAYIHKVSVAPFRGICSADTIVIRSISEEDSALVIACVSSEEFVAHATATSNGAKMPRANWKVLIEYPVLRPTTDLLKKFSRFYDDVIIQQQNLVQKNVVLRQTRDILLPKLISGELDVLELDIDIGEAA
ncbi:MAG TPA: restriction endonuclease subunit S [Desulfobacterales bacterium]|nr:restriction endonuclease subunit S [Desulfobacterales bacterium]